MNAQRREKHLSKISTQGLRSATDEVSREEAAMQLETVNATHEMNDHTGVEEAGVRQSPVKVRVEYSHIEDFLVDYTSNHTIGGMFIKTDRPLAVGTRFLLKFQLPGSGRAIAAEAQVRWTLPVEVAAPMTPGMGVRFGRLSHQDRSAVEALLEKWR